ncbi:MAG: alpha/beta fold hydrolase [Rhodoferax sp.]|uniref:alpha/beta hydrolase n=1 Tax=Rhodoferax sp. TaxID=50421 RepID=UPI002735156E|nr:alpha/beta fold hydrolase [Rhodoferax sp.]MDP2678790.1 alpha/beta fold hydrolase [Rhodoferax sp.]
MSQEWRWLGLRGICVGLMLALSGCAWLDGQQRQIIYRPTLGVPTDFSGLPAGDTRYFVNVAGSDHDTSQHLAIWWLPHATADAPTLLYLHGTFRNLFGNQRKIEALRSAGFSVLAIDYRGWGESSPLTPSEQSILADAQVAWRELTMHQPNPKKRVIYGHSMGSAVALDLASRLQNPADYGGLVLESAFTSFTDVAHASGWLASLLNLFNPERFDSMGKIGRVQAPLLMLHGSQDDTIPIQLGERLFAAANAPKQWVRVEGAAHSDLDQVDPALYQASLQGFAANYLSGQ